MVRRGASDLHLPRLADEWVHLATEDLPLPAGFVDRPALDGLGGCDQAERLIALMDLTPDLRLDGRQ